MSLLNYHILYVITALFLNVDSNPVPTSLVTETQTEEIIEYVTETEDETVTRQPWRHELRTDHGDLLAREIGTAIPLGPELRPNRGNLLRRDEDIATTSETILDEADTTNVVTEIVFEEITELNKDERTAGFTPAPAQEAIEHVARTESEASDSVEHTTESIHEIVQKQNATMEPDSATTILWQTELVEDENQDSVEITTEQIQEIEQKDSSTPVPLEHESVDVTTEQIQDIAQKETSTAVPIANEGTTESQLEQDSLVVTTEQIQDIAQKDSATTAAPLLNVGTTELWQTEIATELIEVTAMDLINATESTNATDYSVTEISTTVKPSGIEIDLEIIVNDGQDPGPGYEVNVNGQHDNSHTGNDNNNGNDGHYFTFSNVGAGFPINVYVHVVPRRRGN